MAYITQSQLEKRFASMQWWTDDAAAGSIDADIVSEIIAIAGGEIDFWAAQQYAVPLTLSDASTAVIIRTIAGDIAGYQLVSRVQAGSIPQTMQDLYDNAIEKLKLIAAGKVHLPGESQVEADKPGAGIVVLGDDPILTRESMDGL